MCSLPVYSSSKLLVSPAVVGEWETGLEGHTVIKDVYMHVNVGGSGKEKFWEFTFPEIDFSAILLCTYSYAKH